MKLDDVNKLVLQEIQDEMLDEDNIDLSIDELYTVANSQFIGGAFAVQLRISYFLAFIGTFVLKNKKAYVESVKEVEKLKDKVSEEEYKKIVLDKRIANKHTMNGSRIETAKEFNQLPSIVSENTTIKHFNELYKEIMQNE